MDPEDAAFLRLLQQDQKGYVTQMILRHCVRANLADQPAMWCCAQTSMFLGEQVRKVRDKDPGLAVWRSYRVLVPLWRADRHEEATDALIALMLPINPDADVARMKKGRDFHADGTLASWRLIRCGLTALPEEFGTVRVTGELDLDHNRIHYLPESFGNITVGAHLYLSDNWLTSLPGNFGNITVGRDLVFTGNQLTSLPESFGNITVGGDLFLNDNELTSLPESFDNITVGGDLFLNRNEIGYLPESFGNITVGRDLLLMGNPIDSIPCGVIRYRIDAALRLQTWPPIVAPP